ncbi:hypothetical protein F511_27340 [Dorcoceras hygrometricum]|uniref:Uncharacterized protein n=1 Tax=Dorcoceras hygrometricum TaxID=472368 RepID=A0A2Z7AM12_9LAMI|nr:hypothetical protein F511_27340 [Dorcoceras hygrometricum]
MDIEEGLKNRRSRVQPPVVQGSRPNVPWVQPPQFPQSSQQLSGLVLTTDKHTRSYQKVVKFSLLGPTVLTYN